MQQFSSLSLFKERSFAESFIHGIYDLRPKSIKIDFTLSLKGTNRYEVGSFVSPEFKVDPSKLEYKEPLENHPQWGSIRNITESIRGREDPRTISRASENVISETYFDPCGDVSLTIERGIMSNPRERLYLYGKDSMPWGRVAEQLEVHGLRLSETENCIYLGEYASATAWRYINKGNYELRFKCPHHSEKPFLSYSKLESSSSGSLKHRQVKTYNDPNLKHFMSRIHIQKERAGKGCRYSDHVCDYWIEIVPL